MGGSKRWTFSETMDIGGQSAVNRDFTVCTLYYPLCVSRRIDTWQIVYPSLQVSSARASHFLDAETCEFPSLSMLPVGH